MLGWPVWLLLLLVKGKYREGLRERMFGVRAGLRGGRQTIWIHAVSVGEVLAISGLVKELAQRQPAYEVVVSTTTRTGQKLARERFGADHCFYFPLDFPWSVAACLRRLKPSVLVLAESELWPNLLSASHQRHVPVVIVNARVSDRSLPRYLRLRRLWRPFLAMLTRVQAQTAEDAARLVRIGVPGERVVVGGNLKFDVRPPAGGVMTELLRSHLRSDAKLLVCGSTLEGEEAMLLAVWPEIVRRVPNAVMLLAPRHPERFAAVAALLAASPFAWTKRSAWIEEPQSVEAGSVLLLDSIGELASLYSLARVAFVGGSLVPAGGHNPLEPAQFGVAIAMGPHVENFRAMVELLMAADGLVIVEAASLADKLAGLLLDESRAAAMGRNAQRVCAEQAGATARAATMIGEVLAGRDEGFAMKPQPWLAPLSPVYGAAVRAKNLAYERGWLTVQRLQSPVVSVGNLSTGGGGKTPLVIAMARLLRGAGMQVDVLSRGYGRSGTGTEQVMPDAEDAARYGDEPVLIAEAAEVPVYVGASRYTAGLLAEQTPNNAKRIHLLDDGFQHRQLARALDIVVLHRSDFTERLLPAGHLREPLASLGRAQVAVLREEDRELASRAAEYLSPRGELWFVQRSVSCALPEGTAMAFCGIARPEEFIRSLHDRGIVLASRRIFPDHYRFREADLKSLIDECRRSGATTLITTEKDAIRLGAGGRAMLAGALALTVATLEVRLQDPSRMVQAVERLLRS